MVFRNDQVTKMEVREIILCAQEALAVKGDFVEMGCYKGDTSLVLAEILKGTGKRLFIYDSFEGLPMKGEKDESVLGQDFREGELKVSKREVKERFLRAGLAVPIIKKGWFSELSDLDLPDEIAFAFLDGDFYESIKDSLRLVLPRLAKGGILIVHDYINPALPGVKKAVDEILKDRNLMLKVKRRGSCVIMSGKGVI